MEAYALIHTHTTPGLLYLALSMPVFSEETIKMPGIYRPSLYSVHVKGETPDPTQHIIKTIRPLTPNQNSHSDYS